MTLQETESYSELMSDRGLVLHLTVHDSQAVPRLVDLFSELSAITGVTILDRSNGNEDIGATRAHGVAIDNATSSASEREQRHRTLTPRELEVLQLMSRGQPNRAIASALAISENTVRAHARNLMQKLKVKNRVQATALAIRFGLSTL